MMFAMKNLFLKIADKFRDGLNVRCLEFWNHNEGVQFITLTISTSAPRSPLALSANFPPVQAPRQRRPGFSKLVATKASIIHNTFAASHVHRTDMNHAGASQFVSTPVCRFLIPKVLPRATALLYNAIRIPDALRAFCKLLDRLQFQFAI
jgi:hypothetical protein